MKSVERIAPKSQGAVVDPLKDFSGPILIADDHPLVRQSLAQTLRERWPQVKLVKVGTAVELREAFRAETPALGIFDYYLDENGCHAVAKELLEGWPEVRLLLLTSSQEPKVYEQILALGFRGIVHKSNESSVVLHAVEEILAGHTFLCRVATQIMTRAVQKTRQRHALLTEMETKVLGEIAIGHNIKELASRLRISTKTAYAHRSQVFHKLNLTDNVAVTLYALEHGLVKPGVGKPGLTAPR